jgi:hypothetical protein
MGALSASAPREIRRETRWRVCWILRRAPDRLFRLALSLKIVTRIYGGGYEGQGKQDNHCDHSQDDHNDGQ